MLFSCLSNLNTDYTCNTDGTVKAEKRQGESSAAFTWAAARASFLLVMEWVFFKAESHYVSLAGLELSM